MAVIEGIGDEVLVFFIGLILGILGVLAWLSTNTTDRPLLGTVVILERHQPRAVASQPTNVPQVVAASTSAPPPEPPANRSRGLIVLSENDASINSTQTTTEDIPIRNPNPADEDKIVKMMDEGVGRPSSEQKGDAPAEPPKSDEVPNRSSVNNVEESADSASAESTPSIRINLKYLNDELKSVEGRLEEQVGDFKRRHFSPELSARSIVRLVFNGKLLGQDTMTLGNYGLHDNCVVHCLVHQQRTPAAPPSGSSVGASPSPPDSFTIGHSLLSNVLLIVLSCILGVAWYGRYNYAQWFTATTTVALVGVTGLFTVFLIGVYIPENNPI